MPSTPIKSCNKYVLSYKDSLNNTHEIGFYARDAYDCLMLAREFISFPKKYNKLIKIEKKISHEKLKRKDNKYDLLIPIKYNFNKTITGMGSCIFIHLTKDYKPTAGCIALKEKDFLIILKLIKKNSKIKIF